MISERRGVIHPNISSSTRIAMRLTYLDTNVYTALADSIDWKEAGDLRDVMMEMEVGVVMSPVVLWEILALGETDKKEKLIWIAQNLALPVMLPEVEAIIVDYAARTVDDSRVEHLVLERVTCREPLQSEWRGVVEDTRRTLRIEPKNIEALQMMRELYGVYHAALSRGLDLSKIWEQEQFTARIKADSSRLFRETAQQLRKAPPPTPRDPQYSMHSALIAAHLMCVGLTPFPEPIDDFWRALKINDVESRMRYLTGREYFWNAGPLLALYNFLSFQSTRKYSRGSWFDAYHLQYLQIVPELLTLDRGMLAYALATPEGSRIHDNVKTAKDFVDEVSRRSRGRSVSARGADKRKGV